MVEHVAAIPENTHTLPFPPPPFRPKRLEWVKIQVFILPLQPEILPFRFSHFHFIAIEVVVVVSCVRFLFLCFIVILFVVCFFVFPPNTLETRSARV